MMGPADDRAVHSPPPSSPRHVTLHHRRPRGGRPGPLPRGTPGITFFCASQAILLSRRKHAPRYVVGTEAAPSSSKPRRPGTFGSRRGRGSTPGNSCRTRAGVRRSPILSFRWRKRAPRSGGGSGNYGETGAPTSRYTLRRPKHYAAQLAPPRWQRTANDERSSSPWFCSRWFDVCSGPLFKGVQYRRPVRQCIAAWGSTSTAPSAVFLHNFMDMARAGSMSEAPLHQRCQLVVSRGDCGWPWARYQWLAGR